MSNEKKARLLLGVNEPVILAVPYSDTIERELVAAELGEHFKVVTYDDDTEAFIVRDSDDEDSYNEYTLPINHALVFNHASIDIIRLSNLFIDYYPVADFTGNFSEEDKTEELVNQLSLRVAKLEELYNTLAEDSRPKRASRKKATKAESGSEAEPATTPAEVETTIKVGSTSTEESSE